MTFLMWLGLGAVALAVLHGLIRLVGGFLLGPPLDTAIVCRQEGDLIWFDRMSSQPPPVSSRSRHSRGTVQPRLVRH